MSQFEYDLFLSHSSEDKPIIRKLAEKLQNDGVRVWLDEWIIQPGDSIPVAIKNGLERSHVVAICWSKDYSESEWGQFEANTFLFRDPNNRERRFVPVWLDNHEIEWSLKQYAYIDYRKQDTKEYERLRDHCQREEPLGTTAVRDVLQSEVFRDDNFVFSFGHTGAIRSVGFSRDNRQAISGSEDRTVRLWDAGTGKCLRVLEGHIECVNSVALSVDGELALSGSDDNTIRLWDVASGKCLRVLKGHMAGVNSVALSADGRHALSGSDDNTIRFWDAESGKCLRALEGHNGGVNSVAFSKDGKRALSGSDDKTVRFWDVMMGTCLRTLKGRKGRVFSVALSADGKHALTGYSDMKIRLWDLGTGKCLRVLEGHTASVNGVALLADGNQAISGSSDESVCLWDAQTGKSLRVLRGPNSKVLSVALSTDGKLALSGSFDKMVRLWNTGTGKCLRVFEGHTDRVLSVAWSADGKQAFTGSADATVRIWDTVTGKCFYMQGGHTGRVLSVALSVDAKQALSGSEDQTVRLWNTVTGKCLRVFEGHTAGVNCVIWSADCKQALSGSEDNTVRLWDAGTGNCLTVFEGHTARVWCVAWSADGKQALSGSEDSTVRLWDLWTGKCLRVLEGHTSGVWSVAWSTDGRQVLSGSEDNTVRLWDAGSGSGLRVLEGHTASVLSVAWSADGRQALSGSEDNTVRLWDSRTGNCLRVLEGHTDYVNRVEWSKDGKQVKSAADNGIWRTWNLAAVPALTTEYVSYTNAKVLMVGESGAGKTGLTIRLTTGKYQPTTSTDAHQTTRLALDHKEEWATRLQLPITGGNAEQEREIWLWDFAGQADYRLIHQIFMDETALAVLVFNPQSETIRNDIATWDTDISRAKRRPFRKILVAGRCDRGGLLIPKSDVHAIRLQRGFVDYIETSAETGAGCKDLHQRIIDSIDWTSIPHKSSPRLFKVLKEEIVRMRDAGLVLLRLDELKQQIEMSLPKESFTPEELKAVVGLLAGPGLIRELEFGDFVLLQPEWINRYAAAVARSIRDRVDDMGAIGEETILRGELNFGSMKRLPKAQEEIVLLAMRQTLVTHGICFAEKTDGGTQLIFPSLYKQEQPENPSHPPQMVTYRIEGSLKEIYSTLIAHLYYSKMVDNPQFWLFAADFETPGDGKRLGLKLTRKQEAAGEISIYFAPQIDINTKVTFLRYIHEHLKAKALKMDRTRHYVCDRCGKGAEPSSVQQRIVDKKKDIICSACEEYRIPFRDAIEERFESEEAKEEARKLELKSQVGLDNESKELTLVGEAMAMVGRAGQIFRPTPKSDHGVDGEIEFKNHRGEASGTKLYLQLKSGDSYLRERKTDGSVMFEVHNELWAENWQRLAYDVMLVIRTADGKVRWMNVTEYLKKHSTREKPVKQIVFEGVDFNEVALLEMRDKLLGR